MQRSQNLVLGKRNYLLVFMLLLATSLICVAFSTGDSDDFNISRRDVLLRRIGHEMLLQSGDSTSRVLPVKKISENEYQIAFEKELTFQPDSLINTTRRALANAALESDYVVNVVHCGNPAIVYGFAISNNKKNDIVACVGRKQPKACYLITIKFKDTGVPINTKYLLGGLPLLAFAGFVFFRSVKKLKVLPNAPLAGTFNLGAVLFDSGSRKLIINEKTMDLTATESRLLLIFALSPNETIERSRLQKEIWEDEGVIVGRSLDMFISKLRKKLEADPNINIVVIRGKGYKLEISS